jgi:hypothetical protein
MNSRCSTTLTALFCIAAPLVASADMPASLTAAVRDALQLRDGSSTPEFEYSLTDLGGDGVQDAVVLIEDQHYCGSGGCTLLILKSIGNAFALLSRSTITKRPIRIAMDRHNGRHTLLVDTGSIGAVELRFNGSGYPSNPSLQPRASQAAIASSQILIN